MVAPELEFYLVARNTDPDMPLKPPIGRSGRAESSRQAYSIDAVNEFDPLFEDVYDYCDKMELNVDTLLMGNFIRDVLAGVPVRMSVLYHLFAGEGYVA